MRHELLVLDVVRHLRLLSEVVRDVARLNVLEVVTLVMVHISIILV